MRHTKLAVFMTVFVAIAIPLSEADIRKKAWKANGVAFNATEKATITTAINLFGSLTITTPSSGMIKLDKCAKCLKAMLANDRICKETDPKHDFGAVADADNSAKCNPKSDGMNISPSSMGVPEVLAGVLAHEWCHLAQANAVGTANFEVPCYEVEVAVLTALKGAAPAANKTAIQNRIEQMNKCITNLKAGLAGAVIPPKTPAFGGTIRDFANGRTFGVFSDSPNLFLGDSTTPLFAVPLSSTRPLGMQVIPDINPGNDLVIISGLTAGDTAGVLEGFLVDTLFSITSVFPAFQLNLGPRHPLSFEFDIDIDRLYLLDSFNSQILAYNYKANTPTLPPGFLGSYADSGLVPDLSVALSLGLPSPGNPGEIVIFEEDLRSVDRAMGSSTAMQTTLFDTDFNNQVDSFQAGLAVDDAINAPGYPNALFAGDTTLQVFASTNATIVVSQVDPLNNNQIELLGSAVVPYPSRYVTIPLSRPLASGEFILAQDATNAFPIPQSPVLVEQPPTTYCTAKLSSAGCSNNIATLSPENPTSGDDNYSVTAENVQGFKNGLLIVSVSGPAAIPFSGGTLCVQPPTKRGPLMNSGGTGLSTCDGSYSTIVNDALVPIGLDPGPGNAGWYQYWYRDPANGPGNLGTALTNAIELSFN